MSPTPSSGARSRPVSTLLRELRKQAGLSAAHVARELGVSPSKISRLETGQRGLSETDVAAFLGLLGVPSERREQILDQVRLRPERGWWHDRGIGLPETWRTLIDFENRAVRMVGFEPLLVPGLLQTAEYAAAAIAATAVRPLARTELDRLVALRTARQAVLGRGALRFEAIVDESVLHRRIGGPGALRRQVEHLRHWARRDGVVLRVVPVRAGAHPGLGGPFVLFDFTDEPSVALLETRHVAHFLDGAEDVDACRLAWEGLHRMSLPPAHSAALLDRLADLLE